MSLIQIPLEPPTPQVPEQGDLFDAQTWESAYREIDDFPTLLIQTRSVAPGELSIIIPAFNEAQRLPRTLKRIYAYIEEHKLSAEVLVVDDGSTDGTRERLVEWPAARP